MRSDVMALSNAGLTKHDQSSSIAASRDMDLLSTLVWPLVVIEEHLLGRSVSRKGVVEGL
jgi:hypothetical protein